MRFLPKFSDTFLSTSVRMLLADYFFGLAAFTILRVGFLLFNFSTSSNVPGNLIVESIFRGVQFDSVVCGMILILPWLILFSGIFLGKHQSKIQNIYSITTNLFFTLAFFAAFVDMPLFEQFGKRLSIAALLWNSSPGFIVKMVFSDWKLIVLLLTFFIFCYLFYKTRKKIKQRILASSISGPTKNKNVFVSILCCGLILLAIRGRISLKSPIRWGTAYFCENTFANQVVLNPFYTFVTSVFGSSGHKQGEFHVMDEKFANKIFLENSGRQMDSTPPLYIQADHEPSRHNVIFVVMESMAGWKTGLYPNGLKWTKHLDSLSKQGIFFSHFYSDGIHTFNGLYSTLTGNHCLPKIHPLNDFNLNSNPVSIAELLKSNGYSTIFFTTHDAEFDNMNGFMRGNGFDEVIGEPDYPAFKGINPMGIPDHRMFDFARNKITKLSENGKPFFATLLTGSDHEPFKVPENIPFGPQGNDDRENAARYADWSIGQFMEKSRKESWYRNTIFVFVADHGGIPIQQACDMYLAFHHIPCIIIGPGISPSVNNNLGAQVDLLRTVMSLLKIKCQDSSMGINLLSEKRKTLYFTYDEEICALDTNTFYVQREIDPHLFQLNETGNNCARLEDGEKIKKDKQFIAATLQLLEERFYGKSQ